MKRRNVLIAGAGGRDFQNFLRFFKDNKNYNVICFTADQIPGIEKRVFPKSLAGGLYKKNIPIYPESDLPKLIKKFNVNDVCFSYSDVSHEHVMHLASITIANGASFMLLGTNDTYIESKVPVVSVCAVRTGSGKSKVSRKIALFFRGLGYKVVAVRHPMPYGDLRKQAVQKFYKYEDLIKNKCTVEEREEYEPHLRQGIAVFAGVDYTNIVKEAEKEFDIIIWDGGNNDFPFVKPNLSLVVVDSRRSDHITKYHPGESNFRMADVILINKMYGSSDEPIKFIKEKAKVLNPKAKVIVIKSEIISKEHSLIKNKDVLVVEDGPTLTHGGMDEGTATVAARIYGAKNIVDAEKYTVGSLKYVYKKYTHLKRILPAEGYSKKQLKELEKTINKAKADLVIQGTPSDLSRLLKLNKPVVYAGYDINDSSLKPLYKILRKVVK
ncbi:GTPase [Candidatus Woesearchaeota archaeon]|nr:GTPase [Candidatus Woesearchaeota archaeon]